MFDIFPLGLLTKKKKNESYLRKKRQKSNVSSLFLILRYKEFWIYKERNVQLNNVEAICFENSLSTVALFCTETRIKNNHSIYTFQKVTLTCFWKGIFIRIQIS